MDARTLHPPAKLNLNLKLLGRRPDGFHEIDTLMIRTSLTDTLTVSVPDEGRFAFTCSDPALPAGADNLVVRAADAFAARTGLPRRAVIHLEKAIPAGGGLGGGSADAALALHALNELHGRPLAPGALAEVAAGLGSDVPFFLGPHRAARCTGRGERITPFEHPALPSRAFVVNPGFGVPTAWAYKAYAALPPEARSGPVNAVFPWGDMRNDLEPAVFAKYLLLPEIKAWLAAQPGVAGAQMSGSGSTMFALLAPDADAEALERRFRERFGPAAFAREVRL